MPQMMTKAHMMIEVVIKSGKNLGFGAILGNNLLVFIGLPSGFGQCYNEVWYDGFWIWFKYLSSGTAQV